MNPVSANASTAAQDRQGVVLLATLGERQTIRYVLEEVAESIRVLEASKYQFKVLIVDDSRDSEFNDHVNAAFNDLRISGKVIDGPKNGLGGAIVYGFETVLADPAIGFVVNLDADGQHDARQMPDLVRAHFATESSITIGSRWTKGGTSPGLSRKRKVLSKVSAAMLHRVGVPSSVKDPTTSFRVYSRNALEKCWREVVDFDGYAFFGGIIAVAASQKLIVSEVPIRFRPRWAGESKMKLGRIAETALKLWAIGSRAKMLERRLELSIRYGIHGAGSNSTVLENHEVMVCAEASTARHQVAYLKNLISGNVLEVGAGVGSFSSHLAPLANQLVCLEPNQGYFSELQKSTHHLNNVSVANETLVEYREKQGMSSGAKKFDTIFYAHVLEHIEHDLEELKLASSFLTESGKLIVVVPSIPRLYGSVDALSGHYRRFTRSELMSISKMAGYEIESIKYFNPIAIFPYWVMYRFLKVRNVGSGQLGLYDRVLVPIAYRTINLFKGKLPGVNLIAVLRKIKD
jgi:2-polyprenyl-3-methyl-5-hydroxy-6-metoxy-1,4-benzoquinol methylase